MSAQRLKRPFAWLLFLPAFLVAMTSANNACSADVLKIYKNRVLEEVTLSEIGLSESGVSTALNPFEADAAWDGTYVDTPELLLEQVYGSTRITRKDVLLWYYEFKKENDQDEDEDDNEEEDDDEDDNGSFLNGQSFHVQYRILSRSGVENALSHKEDRTSVILAHITEKPIECVNKGKNKIRCLGRVDFDLDISRAKRSGKYSGSIEITITTF